MELPPILAHPTLGAGVGLRSKHVSHLLNDGPIVPWLEILLDNYFHTTLTKNNLLEQVTARYPVSMHGVGLSIGSTDPLSKPYLAHLKAMSSQCKPLLISDHLCWVSVNQQYLHELLPLPYTQESLNHVADRIKQVHDFLGQAIALENVSSYFSWESSTMPEWVFMAELAERADCYLLLDVNNIYVSAKNHGWDANDYIRNIPADRVAQYHLGGFTDQGTHLLDTHGAKIADPVWALFEKTIACLGEKPVIVEWDNDIPALETLLLEAKQAQGYLETHRPSNRVLPVL